jgi:hypothetical protein
MYFEERIPILFFKLKALAAGECDDIGNGNLSRYRFIYFSLQNLVFLALMVY